MRSKIAVDLGATLMAMLCLVSVSQAQSIKVPYVSMSGFQWPLWLAERAGTFTKHKLDVQLIYIPGGSLIHPDDISLYQMQLDKARYDAFPKPETLRRMSDQLLERAGLKLSDVACVLCSNISSQDEAAMQQAFEDKVSPVCACNRESHGHLQGTDFPLNYLSLESGSVRQGDYVLGVSHGMGTTAAVSLIRY